MDKIHNVVEKTKELLIPCVNNEADSDIVMAAKREEEMKHKKVLEQIAADKKIAKAAEKLEIRRHKLSLQYIKEASNVNAVADNSLEEQQKQQVVDVADTESSNDTNFPMERKKSVVLLTLERQKSVILGDPALGVQPIPAKPATAWSGIKTVTAMRYDECETFDKEAHELRLKTLEAEEKLAKAAEVLERTMIEKAEKGAAADVKIFEAAVIVAILQEEAQQCHEAVIKNETDETGAS